MFTNELIRMKIAGVEGSYQLRKIRGRNGVVREYWYRYWYDPATQKMQCKREDPPSPPIPKDAPQEVGTLSEEEQQLIQDFRATKQAIELEHTRGSLSSTFTPSGTRLAGEGENVFCSKAEIEQKLRKPYLECTDDEIKGLIWDWYGDIDFTPRPRKVKHILGEGGKVFGLGYEHLTQDEYFQQLGAWDVGILVDVRSRPVSTFFGKGHHGFNKSELKERCAKEFWKGRHTIMYVHVRELGNPIQDDPEWKEKWENGKRFWEYNYGLHKVRELLKEGDICLLCKEEDVSECHRQFIKQDLEAAATQA